ncbi:hypothetical protein NKR23_g8166 [Pleurostoma richardsiae]|uniref:G-patch domain-containing protein n=1 Tax=Pleurostoma richardsiae TaxID=41990 RepID=A0AA38VFY1_9PEZI|nr:hypothetical protein NKR23_g8166 [Pleurostoma richardsiae]
MASDSEQDDFHDDTPLHRKRAFGSGLHRHKVAFVPASSTDATTAEQAAAARAPSAVSDLYLSIVLPRETSAAKPGAPHTNGTEKDGRGEDEPLVAAVCEVCKLPLSSAGPHAAEPSSEGSSSSSSAAVGTSNTQHESSLVHQVCLAHSHPPSALDRSRMGLTILEAQGWDPDARRGLGATQQGIPHPLKAKPKDDKLGIGVEVPKDLEAEFRRRRAEKEKARQGLDAKKVRKMAREDRRKAERLREQIYGRVDLDKYLGTG